jgi:hypothetical protein
MLRGESHSFSRSVSNGLLTSPPSTGFPRPGSAPVYAAENPYPVHLIQSDLWEAITGEKVTPTHICQILNYSMPCSDSGRPYSPQSLQAIQLVLLSKDRQGSRSIQHRLDTSTPADVASIFDALYPNLQELVCDPAANFVIQKLCEMINPAQQDRLLAFFFRDIFSIVDHANSCRVLQKFIETTSTANVAAIFDAVQSRFLHLCLSQNGNHIFQRFIEALPDRLEQIIDCVRPHLIKLAVDNCGCRVVQRLFDRYNVDVLAPLVSEVLKSAADLATNQYGNYVVQNILEAKKPEHVSLLVGAFRGHFYEFSIHKFASNVIEKCIRGANVAEQMVIFTEIIGEGGRFEERRIATMAGDQFGNYVMQRIIEYGTESQRDAIYAVVYDNYDRLISINYAKHVIAKLEGHRYEF